MCLKKKQINKKHKTKETTKLVYCIILFTETKITQY